MYRNAGYETTAATTAAEKLQVVDNKGKAGFGTWLKVQQLKVKKVPQADTAATTAPGIGVDRRFTNS